MHRNNESMTISFNKFIEQFNLIGYVHLQRYFLKSIAIELENKKKSQNRL